MLTNPDTAAPLLLPGARAVGAASCARLRYVVVDECHHYRGVFGSHVAAVLRRLRRVAPATAPTRCSCSRRRRRPSPGEHRRPAHRVAGRGGHRRRLAAGPDHVALWEPPLTDAARRARRAASGGRPPPRPPTCSPTWSSTGCGRWRSCARGAGPRRCATGGAAAARRGRPATWPAGWPPTAAATCPRSAVRWRARCAAASCSGWPATNALELGVDIAGLDAVAAWPGWPGTRAVAVAAGGPGRAGRRQERSRCWSPGRPAGHLPRAPPRGAVRRGRSRRPCSTRTTRTCSGRTCAPPRPSCRCTDDDLALFGPGSARAARRLVARGLLRRRAAGWFWTSRDRAADLADLRGTGGAPVRVVEVGTGRLLGTVDAGRRTPPCTRRGLRAPGQHLRRRRLDLEDARRRWSQPRGPGRRRRSAREVTDIRIAARRDARSGWGAGDCASARSR